MTVNSGFFSDGTEYTQTDFARFLNELIGTGYVPGEGGELIVEAENPQIMKVHIKPGRAYINGYYVNISDDPVRTTLTIDAADATNPRIDRIVLRLSPATDRTITAEVLKGTAAADPQPPALTRTSQIYEISLAQVRVGAGVTSIGAAAITNEKEDNALCGKAMRNIARNAEGMNTSQMPNGTIPVSRIVGGFPLPVHARMVFEDEGMGMLIRGNSYQGPSIGNRPLGMVFQNEGTDSRQMVLNCSFSHGHGSSLSGTVTITKTNVLTGQSTREEHRETLGSSSSRSYTISIKPEEVYGVSTSGFAYTVYVSVSSSPANTTYIGPPTP